MPKIFVGGREIEYEVRRSRRAKRLRLAVYRNCSIVATLPWRGDIGFVEKFILEKAEWLLDRVLKFKSQSSPLAHLGARDYVKHKKQALLFVRDRVEELNKAYGYKIGRISIRNQKTRWGSCSRTGNLNFNYKLVLIPQYIADYVIVHEICHLKEFNHSVNFWELVSVAMPNFREIRRELKKISC